MDAGKSGEGSLHYDCTKKFMWDDCLGSGAQQMADNTERVTGRGSGLSFGDEMNDGTRNKTD